MKRNEGSNYYSLNRRSVPTAEKVVQAASTAITPEQEYAQLKRQYPQQGILKAQTYAGQRGFPVQDVKVEIIKNFPSGKYLVDTQWTDISGLTQPVLLPAHPAEESNQPGNDHPYTTYDVLFTHPDYTTMLVHNVAIFEGITSMQSMEMIPSGAAPDGRNIIEYYVREPDQLNGQRR